MLLGIYKDSNFVSDEITDFHKKNISKHLEMLHNSLSSSTDNQIISYKYFMFPIIGLDNIIYRLASLMYEMYTTSTTFKSPYLLDGMIYTPINQKYTRVVRDIKHKIYKWKPASHNSIDFYNAVLVKSGNDLYSFGHFGSYFCKYIRPNEWQVHTTSYIYVSYGFSQIFKIDSKFIRLSRNTFDCFLDDGTYAPNTIVGPCNLGKNGIRLDDLKNDPKDQDNTDFGSTMVLVEKKQLHYNHL
jgi:hypothetical protein